MCGAVRHSVFWCCSLYSATPSLPTHTHTVTFRKLTACSRSQVKCCFASPSLRPPPPCLPPSSALLPSPHLFDSQGQGDPLYNGTPFITAGTITGDVSLSENFKPILPPHLSLFIFLLSLSPSVFLSRPCFHRLFFLPLLWSASLHGSQ